MASNHTQHYELSQWQATDEVVRTDFNADNAKIDAALHGLVEASAKYGNCRLYTTTYTGTGTYGTSNPTRLTFPSKPCLVMIGAATGSSASLIQGQTSASASGSSLMVTWSGSGVSWYAAGSAAAQLNASGTKYSVVALLNAGE